MREGSERAFDADPPPVVWSYMEADNEWKPFAANQILEDRTNGLRQSGIIQLMIPYDVARENAMLDTDYYWLRASVVDDANHDIEAFPDVIAIKAQAILAELDNRDNDPSHFAKALAPKKIKKLSESNFRIKKLEQPYSSFNGRQPESGNEFYRRVSERLRHRDRAVTIFDYETLLLEEFPAIYRAKCMSHTRWQSDGTLRELAPGYVTIAVIPSLQNQNIFNRAEPRVPIGKRAEMEEWLRKKVSFFLQEKPEYLRVVNPHYEQVRIECKVAFRPRKLDQETYKHKLNADINNFLAPWIANDQANITFGRRLFKSQILYFIETRNYVEAVTGFDVLLNPNAEGEEGTPITTDVIMPTHAHGILTTFTLAGKTAYQTDHVIETALIENLC